MMKHTMQPVHDRKYQEVRRGGVMAVEVIVAATLLLAIMGAFAAGVVSQQRVAKSARHYQLAVHELANQLETLTALPPDQVEEAVRNAQVSPSLNDILDQAKLAGELIRDEDGARVRLTLQWDRGGEAVPLEMTAWISGPVNLAPHDTEVSQ